MNKNDEIISLVNETKKCNWLLSIVEELKSLSIDNNISNFDFTAKELNEIDNLVEKLPQKGSRYIYMFFSDNTELNLISKVFEKYREENKRDVCIAKNNDKKEQAKAIYVGSSSDFSKRIEQHLGNCHRTTYAIRFNEWLNKLPNNPKITCYYFKVETEKQEVLQILEDGIWNELQPIIGKRGGR